MVHAVFALTTALRPRTRVCLHAHVNTLCVSTQAKPTMVSIDGQGIVLEWTYTQDYFSGFGWFNPSRRFEFVLQHAPTALTAPLSFGGADARRRRSVAAPAAAAAAAAAGGRARGNGTGGDDGSGFGGGFDGFSGGSSNNVKLAGAFVRSTANEVHFVTESGGGVARLCMADLATGKLWPAVVEFAAGGVGGGGAACASISYVPGMDVARSDFCYLVVGLCLCRRR